MSMVIYSDVDLLIKESCKLMEKKEVKLQEYNDAVNSECSLKLEYTHKYNELLLNTDFKTVLNESRPTVAMKEARITEQLQSLFDEYEISKNNTELIRKDLELIKDQIRLNEYIIRLRLKE